MSLLHLEDVWKTYIMGETELHALRGVTLSVEAGEFTAVMGASGSGKSTLMNLLGCLDRPTRGRYLLRGEDVSSLPPDALAAIRNRTIGFVFQNFNLLPRTTALENVELPLLYAGLNGAERHARAREALGRVGLTDWAHHHPNQLSGGQQQRVAIARALVNRPHLLLADEPTGNLDSRRSREILELLAELAAERRMPVLLATHDPQAAVVAHRVLTLRDGELSEGLDLDLALPVTP